jgi:hypothetical protein
MPDGREGLDPDPEGPKPYGSVSGNMLTVLMEACEPVCRDPEDHRWKLGPGVKEPVRLDLTTQERKRALQYTIKYKGDR